MKNTNPILPKDDARYVLIRIPLVNNQSQYLIDLLGNNIMSVSDLMLLDSDKQPQQEMPTVEEWISYPEMLKRYNFRGMKSVKDAQWRKKHNFYPCKQDGKGCAMRISASKLDKWLRGEPE